MVVRIEWVDMAAVPVPEPVETAPQKLAVRKPQSFNVRVVFDPNTETYTASWGTSADLKCEAPSMPTALRLLANRMDGLHLHGASRDVLEALRIDPDILCKYCNSPIFFARLPSGKFLPFEPNPIDASDVKGLRVATFSNMVDTRNRPVVLWPSRPEGPVWIPHPEVCGSKSTPPENEALRARWEVRRVGALREREIIIAGLQEIRRDLTVGET